MAIDTAMKVRFVSFQGIFKPKCDDFYILEILRDKSKSHLGNKLKSIRGGAVEISKIDWTTITTWEVPPRRNLSRRFSGLFYKPLPVDCATYHILAPLITKPNEFFIYLFFVLTNVKFQWQSSLKKKHFSIRGAFICK